MKLEVSVPELVEVFKGPEAPRNKLEIVTAGNNFVIALIPFSGTYPFYRGKENATAIAPPRGQIITAADK